MYSSKIHSKVDTIFEDIHNRVVSIIDMSLSTSQVIDRVISIASSELTTRSKSLLSDMLFDLSDELMKTDFFSNISLQNRFYEANLRQEILDKFKFKPSVTIDYRVIPRELESLAVSTGVLVVGGTALAKGLGISVLAPIPIGILLVASVGAALVYYIVISPARSKKQLTIATDNYLSQLKKQFLRWFDKVEEYHNKRVEKIKKTI